jgi:hypothetical protein
LFLFFFFITYRPDFKKHFFFDHFVLLQQSIELYWIELLSWYNHYEYFSIFRLLILYSCFDSLIELR